MTNKYWSPLTVFVKSDFYWCPNASLKWMRELLFLNIVLMSIWTLFFSTVLTRKNNSISHVQYLPENELRGMWIITIFCREQSVTTKQYLIRSSYGYDGWINRPKTWVPYLFSISQQWSFQPWTRRFPSISSQQLLNWLWWILMIFTDIFTFHLAPPTGQNFHISNLISQQLLDGLPWKFVQTLVVAIGWIPPTKVIPVLISNSTIRLNLLFLVKFLDKYMMDCYEIGFIH